MKINEVAKLTGITVRTLHYYDEIGLLHPSKITDAGYRVYEEQELERLQQILFFRELGFPLKEIKLVMNCSSYDKNEILNRHKELLIKKRERLDNLISLVENTIKGECDMSFKQFDSSEIENAKKNYVKEVKERWGNTEAYSEYEQKANQYDDQKWDFINGQGAEVLKEFGENREIAPDSEQAQVLVKRWQDYITSNFYNCTKEILSCLGMMYMNDERFKKNIDQNGEGTAEFMANAIAVYCSK